MIEAEVMTDLTSEMIELEKQNLMEEIDNCKTQMTEAIMLREALEDKLKKTEM